MDSHASVWHLELGIWTPALYFALSSWGYGLPCFSKAPLVGDVDFHPWVWPLESGICTPMLQLGPSGGGYGLPHFNVPPQFWDLDSHALVWHLELGIWTLALYFGLSMYLRLTWKCEVGAHLGLKRLIWG